MINIPDRTQDAGIPKQWDDTITGAEIGLITGNVPALLTQDRIFAAEQTIPALTPVGEDENGHLVPAVSGTTQAIGITVIPVVTGATPDKGGPVYRAGCLNPDRLNWDESYADDAAKFTAFEGAPSPTNIVMRRIKTATV